MIRVTRSGARVLSTGLRRHSSGSPAARRPATRLRVAALAGDDDVAVAADVRDLIATIVDLGEDDWLRSTTRCRRISPGSNAPSSNRRDGAVSRRNLSASSAVVESA